MLPLAQNHKPAAQMIIQRRGGFGRSSRQGFTLLELLLAVSLVVVLVGALVFNFSNLGRTNQLAEGTTQLETLMRFARAQAANSGKKVQLVFNSENTNSPAAATGEVRATWERDPLRQPGCFSDLGDAQWHVKEINDLVQVESVKLLEPAAASPPQPICEDDEMNDEMTASVSKPMSPITFYPDGSSDSAEIILSPRSMEESQRMAVRLVGITGSISHQLLSTDLEEPNLEPLPGERPAILRRDGTSRGAGSELEPTAPAQNLRSATSASRTLSSAARAPVGETNSVDLGF